MGDDNIPADTDAFREEGDKRYSPVKMKPPNKKKFEEDLQSLVTCIQEKEMQLKFLKDSSLSEDHAVSKLRQIRAEKDVSIELRKKIDTDLRAVNQEISKKMDALTKVQATLHYRTENRINDAIRKLEHQLKIHNFKLSEERKIVAEIDSLRRSKKVLSQYLTQKAEIDEMRDRQRKMREERDRQFKIVTGLKSKEEEQRRTLSNSRSKADDLKKDLDHLYEQKRRMVSEYKREILDYNAERSEIRKKLRHESFKKREEERRAHAEAKQKEIEEYEATRKPYEVERLMCSALIAYLHRFQTPETRTGTAGDVDSHGAPSIPEGATVLKKRPSDEEVVPGGWRKQTSKRNKRDRKRSQNKPLSHTPQTLAQFASLNLISPSHTEEIAASIEQLLARMNYYDSLPPPVRGEVRNLPNISVQEVDVNSTGSLPDSTDSNAFSFSRSISHTESEGSYEQPVCVTDLEESAEEEGEKEKGREEGPVFYARTSKEAEKSVHSGSDWDLPSAPEITASLADPPPVVSSQTVLNTAETDADLGPRSSADSTSSDSSHSTVTEHTGDSPHDLSHDTSHGRSHDTHCDPLHSKSHEFRDKERRVNFKDSNDVIDPIDVDLVHEDLMEEEGASIQNTSGIDGSGEGATDKKSPIETSNSSYLTRNKNKIESLQDIFDKLDFTEMDGETGASL